MTLSVCMITAEPAARVAAILSPLRDVATEVVIAADHRVDPRTLAGYAKFADVLRRIEYRQMERHLGWLYAQCSGEWILRLDGDEVLSAGLLRRLPELIASRRVAQYAVPLAWCYQDATQILDEAPWAADFNNRLVRNTGDALRFGGEQHAHAVPTSPLGFEPDAVYHLDLLLNSFEARQDKAVRYEVARPRLVPEGGGRFNEAYYLPELRLRPPRLRRVPDEDVAAIKRVMAATDEPEPNAGPDLPVVGLEELDRFWPGRLVHPAAYRACIEPYGRGHRLEPGERGTFYVSVHNTGVERWSYSLDEAPGIRLSYRLLREDGTVVAEGGRTPFARAVAPGELILTPVVVDAPEEPGSYLVAVDVVHEDVRWFGAECRLELEVGVQTVLPPAAGRLTAQAPPRPCAQHQESIPRTIHRVWLGPGPMPAELVAFGEGFAHNHPRWQVRLWTDDDLETLGIDASERAAARDLVELSNLARYEILAREGGVYVDADVESRRPLDALLRDVDVFAGLESPGRVGTAVLGAFAGHSAFVRAARMARSTLGIGAHRDDANGAYFLSLVLEQQADVTILGPEHFPAAVGGEDLVEAYCVRH